MGRLDLLSLLRTGIPIELPGDQRLIIGVLRPDSAYRGRALGADHGKLADHLQLFAIIRGEHMMVPRPDTVLEAGDRLILLTTRTQLEEVQQHVGVW